MKFATAVLSLLSSAAAIESFLSAPNQLWSVEVPKPGRGNACVLSSSSNMLFCTAADGRISAHGTADGMMAWEHPATGNGTVTCTTGVTISNDEAYMVYGVTDTEGTMATCKVYALGLDMEGTVLWTSDPLEGACSGTPVVSFDGSYVFLTHSMSNSGTFTVLNNDGTTLFQSSDTTLPLSPPGIFHRPAEGSYQGGQSNNNDIVVWGNTPLPIGEQVGVSTEAKSYVFQFPVGYSGADSELAVSVLIDSVLTNAVFQTLTAPLITNGGTSMYWGTSRSEIIAWPQGRFDVTPGGNKVNFPRGEPAYLPPLSEIAITQTNTLAPVLFSSGGGNEVGAISTGIGGNLMKLWEVETITPAYVKPQVSPDDAVVYTIEEGVGTIDGAIVHQLNATTGESMWKAMPNLFVRGSGFAQSEMGDVIYFAGEDLSVVNKGRLFAWEVATLPPTTMPPVTMTAAPVTAAPVTPAPVMTAAPVTMPPVVAPTPGMVTTLAPTDAPVTPAPVDTPTTPAPVDAGTPATPAPVDDATTTDAPTESSSATMGTVVATVVAVVGSVIVSM